MPTAPPLIAALLLLSVAPCFAAETEVPPDPAAIAEKARVAAGLLPAVATPDAEYAALLKSARDAGVSERRLLESEVHRALVHRVKTSDCAALAARLAKLAKNWNPDDAALIDSPALADALVHALLARHALLASNDPAKFRAEAAEAVWRSTRLADLIAVLEAERSREALLATPAFKALEKAAAAGDDAAARRAFDEAFWASPPLSCDLAVEKIDAMRDAREEVNAPATKSGSPASPPKGVAAFVPARHARVASITPSVSR